MCHYFNKPRISPVNLEYLRGGIVIVFAAKLCYKIMTY